MDDDYKPRCRRGHFMKGRVFTGEGGGDEVEWRCDYCRRLAHDPTERWCEHHESPGSCPVYGCAHHSTDLDPTPKENTMTCTFCNEPSDDLSTGSDGKTRACPDCIASAD
jgi:hypothetical protein